MPISRVLCADVMASNPPTPIARTTSAPAASDPNNHAGSALSLMLSNNPRECVAALSTRRPAASQVANNERKERLGGIIGANVVPAETTAPG